MAKRTYRTASGKMVDMDTLALKNETVIAVGNMNVNARGDKLGNGGKVVQSREELMSNHYRVRGNTIPEEKPLPQAGPKKTQKIIDDDPVGPMDTPAEPDPEPELPEEVLDVYNDDRLSTPQDIAEQDEWVEDSDGNFVRSSDLTEQQETSEVEKPTTRGIADALAGAKSVSVPFEETEKQKSRKKRGVKRI